MGDCEIIGRAVGYDWDTGGKTDAAKDRSVWDDTYRFEPDEEHSGMDELEMT